MATIDIKLKTYEQLQFEIMKLNTDIVLKDKQLDKYKNVIDKIKEIMGADLSNMQKLIAINIMLKKDELLEEIE